MKYFSIMREYIYQKKVLIAPLFVLVFFFCFYLGAANIFAGDLPVLLVSVFLSAFSLAFAYLYSGTYSQSVAASFLGLSLILVFGYLKFLWILFFPESLNPYYQEFLWFVFRSRDALLSALTAQSVATAGFSAAVILGAYLSSKCFIGNRQLPVAPPSVEVEHSGVVLFSLLFFVFVVHVLIFRYKIGFMGLNPQPLPLHLAGILHYTNTIVIPYFILIYVFVSGRTAHLLFSRSGLALLLCWAISDTFLRTSRASLFLAPLLIVLLALTGGLQLRRLEKIFLGVVFFLALLSVPFVSEYRVARAIGESGLPAVSLAIDNVSKRENRYLGSLDFLFMRIPGIETTTLIMGVGGAPLKDRAVEVLFSKDSVPGYITKELLGIKSVQGLAPGLVGTLYLVGGYSGILTIFFVLGLLASFGWDYVTGLHIVTMPVLKAYLLFFFFSLLTEGSIQVFAKQLPFIAFSVVLCELYVVAGKVRNS